jgi:hypothetical protein
LHPLDTILIVSMFKLGFWTDCSGHNCTSLFKLHVRVHIPIPLRKYKYIRSGRACWYTTPPPRPGVRSRVDPRVVDAITTLTNSHLPHNKLTFCSPPTRLADCGAAAVAVDPSGPLSITCAAPCAPKPKRHVRCRHANVPPLTTTSTRLSLNTYK